MSDPIDQIPATGPRATERISGSNRPGLRLKKDDDSHSSYEDQVDIHPAWRMQNSPSELDLSIAMIRALIAEELPPEAIEALMSYAPLGDLTDAGFWCDRVEQKGMDIIRWPSGLSLAQALERAAS